MHYMRSIKFSCWNVKLLRWTHDNSLFLSLNKSFFTYTHHLTMSRSNWQDTVVVSGWWVASEWRSSLIYHSLLFTHVLALTMNHACWSQTFLSLHSQNTFFFSFCKSICLTQENNFIGIHENNYVEIAMKINLHNTTLKCIFFQISVI